MPGWNKKGNLTCPCCGSITDSTTIRELSKNHLLGEDLIAVILGGDCGIEYITPTFKVKIPDIDNIEGIRPTERMAPHTTGGDISIWGYETWGDLFSIRQLYVINAFIQQFLSLDMHLPTSSYYDAVLTYLAIWLDRYIVGSTSLGRWNNSREVSQSPFSKQAIAMTYDYPEVNPFSSRSGSAISQIEWVLRYIDSESYNQFNATFANATSGDKSQFVTKSIDAVVTDPPYYDAMAYADLSDFFYVWLKKMLYSRYQLNFSTPQTPKLDECTALKHHHNNSAEEANRHFENKLLSIFEAIENQTKDIVAIMFAHQSTKAWTTLCNSILGANMNIQGSWAIDTERDVRMLAITGDALESSVTVACTPSERKGYGSYKKVKQAIQRKVEEEVKNLYDLGFRGADLLTACFGKAVSEFGNYEHVEKADGSEVTVAELLDMARTAAFTALIRDFASDDYTKFYIGWLQLNGMGETDYDDATKFTRAGMNVNIGDIFAHDILVKNESGNTQHLGSYKERAKHSLNIPSEDAPLIDKVHYAMYYWKDEDRNQLLQLIAAYGQDINNEFWRVFTVLKELLPEGDDREQVIALLNNAETLIKASKSGPVKAVQGTFDFGE